MRKISQKIIFKLLRAPIPWVARRILNQLTAMLSLRYLPGEKNSKQLKSLIKTGQIVIDANEFDIDLDQLIEIASSSRLFDQWAGPKEFFTLENAPSHVNVASVELTDSTLRVLAAIEDKLTRHPLLIGYFNAIPKVVDRSIWWSFGGKDEREAQLWHRDIDNLYFLKVFVYLTDVDENSGPHLFVSGSHKFMKWLTFQRLSERDIKRLGAPIITNVGPRGTMILEDTFGIHKGLVPSPGFARCILQFQFALYPNP